jgi:glycosyltransferase involved in cell wall biosynthesis
MAAPEAGTTRVLFDATRLLGRGLAMPTGIDRVDFAYVSALSATRGFDLRLVTFDVFGPKLLGQGPTKRLIEAVRQRWETHLVPDQSQPGFQRLRQWLEAPAGNPIHPTPGGQGGTEGSHMQRAGAALNGALDSLRLRRTLGDGASSVYVNTSHGQLFRKAVSRWLGNSDIGSVFFIHDLLPIEFPEFNRQREPARHAARLETIGAHARQIIVNSDATRATLLRYLREHGRRVPPIEVLHLGIDDRFDQARDHAPLSPAAPYFVMLCTIEPRKNHLLMLQVWRRLVESAGDAAPRLVLIGRRGWENQIVFNTLDRSTPVSRFIAEGSSMGDGDIAALLRGARALLSPSFGEGFGLPVAEALKLGTPVIASAIPAHLEVGGDFAEYLDPLDGLGWLQAIRDYAAEPSPRREKQLQRLKDYKPPRWNEHLSSALDLIRAAAHQA